MRQQPCNHSKLVQSLQALAETGSSGVFLKGKLVDTNEASQIGKLMSSVAQQSLSGNRHLQYPDWRSLPPLP